MPTVGNEISIMGLCSTSCTVAIMKVFQLAEDPTVCAVRIIYTHDPLPAWEALMEVYDNKDFVIYGLLWKRSLMRLNNFIAQVFLKTWFVAGSWW